MRRAHILFLCLLGLAAALMLGYSGRFVPTGEWIWLLLLAMVMVFSSQVVLTEVSIGALDFLGAGALFAFLVKGPHVGVWALAVAVVLETLLRSGHLTSLGFNLPAALITAWSSFQAFSLLGGKWGPAFDHPVQALLGAVVYLFVDSLLFAVSLQTAGRMSIRQALTAILNPGSIRAYMITLMVGILAGFAYLRGGPLWAGLVAALAYLLHMTLCQYFKAVNDACHRAQTSQGALIMTDPHGIIQVVNRQAEVLLDAPREELVGRDASKIAALKRMALPDTGKKDNLEEVLELAEGPIRFVHWYRTAVRDPQGDLQGHIQVFTDVTPIKEAEENWRHLYDSVVSVLTAAIDARDSYTHGHSARVSAYSVAIARHLGLSKEDVDRIRYAALLHDIGKLGVDDSVLRKRSALTPEERALMMQHPVIGASVLERANLLTDLIPGVRWHHEWFGGGGYPDGLAREDIPMDARIISVADALDAMTSHRPYRAAMPLEEALDRLQRSVDIQFDPQAVAAALEAVRAGEITVTQQSDPWEAGAETLDEGLIRPVHGKELSVFYKLAMADYSSLGLIPMLKQYLKTLYEVLGANVYMIYLWNSETERPELGACIGVQEDVAKARKEMRFVNQVLVSQHSVVHNDLYSLTGYRAACPLAQSEVVLPIGTEETVLGALVVESPLPGFFGPEDVRLLELLAKRLDSAIKLCRYTERLTRAAIEDGLTGVYNHRYFCDRLAAEVEKASDTGTPVALLLLDINGMKTVNDTYGHLVGDQVLQAYGRILKDQVRAGVDMVARYGGDEFAIIMPGQERDAAEQVAVRLVEALNQQVICEGQRVALPVPAWGVGAYPWDGKHSADLVAAADNRLYQQKRSYYRNLGLDRRTCAQGNEGLQ